MANFNINLIKATHSWVPCRVIECRYHKMGYCKKAENCSFYHGIHDQRYPPDLSKTQLCPSIKDSTYICENENECMYAHSKNELRKPPHKSVLCRAWLTDGSCPYSDCHYAHSFDEITTDLLHPELGGVPPPPTNILNKTALTSTAHAIADMPSPVNTPYGKKITSSPSAPLNSRIPPPPPLKNQNCANSPSSKTTKFATKKKTSFSNVTYLPPPPPSPILSPPFSSSLTIFSPADLTTISDEAPDILSPTNSPIHTNEKMSVSTLSISSDIFHSSLSLHSSTELKPSSSSSDHFPSYPPSSSSASSFNVIINCDDDSTSSIALPPPFRFKTPKTCKSIFSCISPTSSYITATPNTYINSLNVDTQSFSPHALSTYEYEHSSESIGVSTPKKYNTHSFEVPLSCKHDIYDERVSCRLTYNQDISHNETGINIEGDHYDITNFKNEKNIKEFQNQNKQINYERTNMYYYEKQNNLSNEKERWGDMENDEGDKDLNYYNQTDEYEKQEYEDKEENGILEDNYNAKESEDSPKNSLFSFLASSYMNITSNGNQNNYCPNTKTNDSVHTQDVSVPSYTSTPPHKSSPVCYPSYILPQIAKPPSDMCGNSLNNMMHIPNAFYPHSQYPYYVTPYYYNNVYQTSPTPAHPYAYGSSSPFPNNFPYSSASSYIQTPISSSSSPSGEANKNQYMHPQSKNHFSENNDFAEGDLECMYAHAPYKYDKSQDQQGNGFIHQEAISIHKQIELICRSWGSETTCYNLQSNAIPPHMYSD